jgi:nitroimidazol reductase NimA-like FMN-containing flavoprotein (pyridoxamine 5'-phosphate oxidase superfamily)
MNRSQIRQHAERSVPEQAAEILLEGQVAHVGFVEDGQPYVIPMGYHFDAAKPDRMYLHGSPESRAMKHLASGAAVCATVTLLDGLVYSRTALYHSMNYRSVVGFGHGRTVTDEQTQRRVFQAMVGRYFAGRKEGVDYSAPTAEQLGATALVELVMDEWSAKAREGGPKGPLDAREDAPGTCGVTPP